MMWRKKERAPFVHKVVYYFDVGTGMGDDREGLHCGCGWSTLGTSKMAQRAAGQHERMANR